MDRNVRAVIGVVTVVALAGPVLPDLAAADVDEPGRAELVLEAALADGIVDQRSAGTSLDGFTAADAQPVGPLEAWTDLRWVARDWAGELADRRTLDHNDRLSTQLDGWTWIAENLGRTSVGPASRPPTVEDLEQAAGELLSAWFRSDYHRNVWMRPRAEHLGVGAALRVEDGTWVVTAVAVFRDPDDAGPTGASPLDIDGLLPPLALRDVTDTCGGAPDAGFVDVGAGGVFADAIDCIAAAGVTRGTSPDRYSPDRTVTVEQLAAFTNRMLAAAGAPVDADADACRTGSLLDEDLDAMVAIGALDAWECGTATEPATRTQLASFVARALQHAGAAGTGAPDAFLDDTGHPAEPDHDLVAAQGVVVGYPDGWFRPGTHVTRGQMAQFLAAGLDALLDA